METCEDFPLTVTATVELAEELLVEFRCPEGHCFYGVDPAPSSWPLPPRR